MKTSLLCVHTIILTLTTDYPVCVIFPSQWVLTFPMPTLISFFHKTVNYVVLVPG